MRLKVSSAKRRSFCLGLKELTYWGWNKMLVFLWEIFLVGAYLIIQVGTNQKYFMKIDVFWLKFN